MKQEVVVFDPHGVFELRDHDLIEIAAARGAIFRPEEDGVVDNVACGNTACGRDTTCIHINGACLDIGCPINVGFCLQVICKVQ